MNENNLPDEPNILEPHEITDERISELNFFLDYFLDHHKHYISSNY